IFAVPYWALTKTARAWARLKTTVFLLRPRRKWRPRMVSDSPTETFIGATFVITGGFVLLLASAGDATAPADAEATRAARAAIVAARRGQMRARSSIALHIGGLNAGLEPPEDQATTVSPLGVVLRT